MAKAANRAHDRALLAAFLWPRSYQEVADELGVKQSAAKCVVLRLVESKHLRFAGFGTFSSRQRAMYVGTGKPIVTMQETFERAVLALPEITVEAIRRRLKMSTPDISRRTKEMEAAGQIVRVTRAPALWVPA